MFKCNHMSLCLSTNLNTLDPLMLVYFNVSLRISHYQIILVGVVFKAKTTMGYWCTRSLLLVSVWGFKARNIHEFRYLSCLTCCTNTINLNIHSPLKLCNTKKRRLTKKSFHTGFIITQHFRAIANIEKNNLKSKIKVC